MRHCQFILQIMFLCDISGSTILSNISDFDLLCSLIHSHLALYQASVRWRVSLATRPPSSLALLTTACRSLRLAVNNCGSI